MTKQASILDHLDAEAGFRSDQRMTGHEAIQYAQRYGLTLNKYADPVEGPREGLSVEEARDVAREDPSLIYVDVPGR